MVHFHFTAQFADNLCMNISIFR